MNTRESRNQDNSPEALRTLCKAQLRMIDIGQAASPVVDQLDWELNAICNTHTESMFISWHQMCQEIGIESSDVYVRGTIGNLLVSYLVGITNYNPLDYQLSPCMAFGCDGMRVPTFAVSLPNEQYKQVMQWQIENGMLADTWDLLVHKDEVDDTVRAIITSVSPNDLNELVRALSLAYGTGTWEDNAETLLAQGKVGLSEVISNRDDVYDFLKIKGLDTATAYKIAMLVSRGRLARPLHYSDDHIHAIKAMRNIGVPEWYIDSCRKIYYLFPRAYAISYANHMI